MRHVIFTLLICTVTSNFACAQTNAEKPCNVPECSQFDFCVGEGDVVYKDAHHSGIQPMEEIVAANGGG